MEIGSCSGVFLKNFLENVKTQILDNLNGLIVGGKDEKYAPNRGGISFNVFDKICEYIGSVVPDFAYFKGQKGTMADIHYSGNNNTWSISKSFGETIELPEQLARMFNEVHIPPNYKLYIGDKQIKEADYPPFFISKKQRPASNAT